ncbi:hypothetical protein FF1_043563 [Malus domestica]
MPETPTTTPSANQVQRLHRLQFRFTSGVAIDLAITKSRCRSAHFVPSAPSFMNQSTSLSGSSWCSSGEPSRALILYSKPECCLCDGLKEKLEAAFLLSGPDSLHNIDFQVRYIMSNPEWERAYQYEIPVLARVLSDGTEKTLPRLSPRLAPSSSIKVKRQRP